MTSGTEASRQFAEDDHARPGRRLELAAGAWGNGGICACRQEESPVVLLSGAVPGERVIAEVTAMTRSYWRARVVKVLEPSPDRVEPPWPEGLDVGAADWLYLAPAAARRAKGEVVAGLLGHALGGDFELTVEPLGDGSPLGWRTKIELSVGEDGRAGMFAAGSHRFSPLSAMPLAVPAIEALDLFSRRWPEGSRLSAVAPSAGAAFCLTGAEQSAKARREVVRVAGSEFRYELAAGGFWQVHRLAPETLAGAVLKALRPEPGQAVWDLYAGAGLFTLPLAAAGARVGAVEGSRRAVKDLRGNIRRAGLELERAEANSVGNALRAGLAPDQPAAVLLDPPRAGAGRAVMESVAAAGPARVLYLACEPAALARDLAVLSGRGYRLADLRAFDLFPGTHHVEVMALAERI
ncbi:MAG: RNA methyltransferase [Bifidobacteriaceae bacterium]|jgi:tRNA/tmRNA/rRNA uracil-C5-methylase (TrmA/RlmC/RlmD family)|nr:RNA methyltransferase [Bifidobacteriaceae bacterium]